MKVVYKENTHFFKYDNKFSSSSVEYLNTGLGYYFFLLENDW